MLEPIFTKEQNKEGYRVFISYSHKDFELINLIEKILKPIVTIMRDNRFNIGPELDDQIKMFIVHSHIFLPIITKSSSKSGWVHQEIGYANAMRIPIFPIVVGKLPDQMIKRLNALKLPRNKEEWELILKQKLTIDAFTTLINNFKNIQNARYQCAYEHEDRTALIVEYAKKVRELGYYGLVRQKGALSSFHIPNKTIVSP